MTKGSRTASRTSQRPRDGAVGARCVPWARLRGGHSTPGRLGLRLRQVETMTSAKWRECSERRPPHRVSPPKPHAAPSRPCPAEDDRPGGRGRLVLCVFLYEGVSGVAGMLSLLVYEFTTSVTHLIPFGSEWFLTRIVHVLPGKQLIATAVFQADSARCHPTRPCEWKGSRGVISFWTSGHRRPRQCAPRHPGRHARLVILVELKLSSWKNYVNAPINAFREITRMIDFSLCQRDDNMTIFCLKL